MKVNIFASSLEFGDGVSNDVIDMNKALKELGYESEVYSRYVDDKFDYPYKQILDYGGDSNSVMIIQHSMLLIPFDKLVNLPDRKILRYQNITPAKFFKYNPEIVNNILLGTSQVRRIKDYVRLAIGSSRYTELELNRFGFSRTRALPIVLNYKRFERESLNMEAQKIQKELRQNDCSVTCFGRVVKNKNQYLIVKAFINTIKKNNLNAKLYLVGNDYQSKEYVKKIKDLIKKHNVSDRVVFAGKVSDDEWAIYFKESDIMINYSDHEGFCIPLLESMYNKTAIIAKNTTSMPFVLGGTGMLVNDYRELTIAIESLITDKDLRSKIVKEQTKRLEDFSYQQTKGRLDSYVKEVIDNDFKPSVNITSDNNDFNQKKAEELALELYHSGKYGSVMLSLNKDSNHYDLSKAKELDLYYMLEKGRFPKKVDVNIAYKGRPVSIRKQGKLNLQIVGNDYNQYDHGWKSLKGSDLNKQSDLNLIDKEIQEYRHFNTVGIICSLKAEDTARFFVNNVIESELDKGYTGYSIFTNEHETGMNSLYCWDSRLETSNAQNLFDSIYLNNLSKVVFIYEPEVFSADSFKELLYKLSNLGIEIEVKFLTTKSQLSITEPKIEEIIYALDVFGVTYSI